MKYPLRISKISRQFLPIVVIMALAIMISSRFFETSSVLAQNVPIQDVSGCYMETSKGQVVNLEGLCGQSQRNANQNLPLAASSTTSSIGNSNQSEENLAWKNNYPSAPISNSPSPYNHQAIKDFNRILYGD
jgi:hypothetical protein